MLADRSSTGPRSAQAGLRLGRSSASACCSSRRLARRRLAARRRTTGAPAPVARRRVRRRHGRVRGRPASAAVVSASTCSRNDRERLSRSTTAGRGRSRRSSTRCARGSTTTTSTRVVFSLESVVADLGFGDVRPLPGSVAWIDRLREEGKRIALVYAGERAERALEHRRHRRPLRRRRERAARRRDGRRGRSTTLGVPADRAVVVDVVPEGPDGGARGRLRADGDRVARGVRDARAAAPAAAPHAVVADLQELLGPTSTERPAAGRALRRAAGRGQPVGEQPRGRLDGEPARAVGAPGDAPRPPRRPSRACTAATARGRRSRAPSARSGAGGARPRGGARRPRARGAGRCSPRRPRRRRSARSMTARPPPSTIPRLRSGWASRSPKPARAQLARRPRRTPRRRRGTGPRRAASARPAARAR